MASTSSGSSSTSEPSTATPLSASIAGLHLSRTEEDVGADAGAEASDSRSPSPTIRFRGIDSNMEEQFTTLSNYRCPIIGHEVMEERARFTVYKLRVENLATGDCWFVFRRYTDFVRLYNKLKTDFPDVELPLPRKRWFGDNFNPSFIHERTLGLQQFVNSIFKKEQLQLSMALREFFCLDEPPTAADGMDESRAALEALMDTLQQTRLELVEKELMLHTMKEALDHTTLENEQLKQRLRNCSECSKMKV
ncbi:sorting nexin-16 [Neocloeon triangulifer]|uniref:sorting nexin-16 n=1 Tax=Neocloeon triangulifer TaxID=2078957 RepID=UPI00286FAE66|nr:sorting nexin-16 [Neocloeon triangulifer]